MTYKNTTPASINYFSGNQGTSVGFESWTTPNAYLADINTSLDPAGSFGTEMAFQFVGSDGSFIICGNFNPGSSFAVNPVGQTDPIPVFFDWDVYGDHFDGIIVNSVDYNGIDPAQLCIRDNTC